MNGRPATARPILRARAAVLALCLACAAAAWWTTVAAQTGIGADGPRAIPPLAARVTDLTQTLAPAEKQSLEAKLADWEARTSNQLAVLIVPTTAPEAIEAYSIRVAEAWKIGRKGSDNGALFLVAKDDRKMRIEVGYGLEGTLTDVTSRRIIAEDVAPLFREGKFAAGIAAGVDRIISVVAGGKPLPPPAAAKSGATPGAGDFDFGTLLLFVFIGIPILGALLRSIFGNIAGSTVGAGIVGTAAWFLLGSIVIAVIAAIVGFIIMIFTGTAGSGLLGRGGRSLPSGGWSSGGSSGGGFSSGGGGGGGFSGGGGSFGGGGASGGW